MIFNQTGGGGSPELQAKTASPSTSQQIITPDTGFDGLSQVTVTPALLETKSVTPSTSQQTITPSSGYYGMGQVTVSGARLQSRTVTPSGSYQNITPASGYYGLSSVGVSAINLQSKSVVPSSSQQIITPDSSYQGLSQVVVGAVSSNGYVISQNVRSFSTDFITIDMPSLSGNNLEIAAANLYVRYTGDYSGSKYYIDELYIAQIKDTEDCNALYTTIGDAQIDAAGYYLNQAGSPSLYLYHLSPEDLDGWELRVTNPGIDFRTFDERYEVTGFISIK